MHEVYQTDRDDKTRQQASWDDAYPPAMPFGVDRAIGLSSCLLKGINMVPPELRSYATCHSGI